MILPAYLRKFLKQREMTRFYREFIGKDDLCFDIGANSGERTDCFLKLGAKVIAVEPQSACIENLVRKYHRTNRVTVLQCAVGSNEREDELMLCDETDECSTLSMDFIKAYSDMSGFHWKKSEKERVTTLERMFAEFGLPRFCKIDVEGYESEVFLGMKTPVKFISFEFNKPLLKDTVKSLVKLGTIGNYQCNYIQYEKMKYIMEKFIPIDEFGGMIENIITSGSLTGEIFLRNEEQD